MRLCNLLTDPVILSLTTYLCVAVDDDQELMAQCDTLQLKYKFLESSSSCEGTTLVAEGVEVVFRVSIPSSERTALLLQSTGELLQLLPFIFCETMGTMRIFDSTVL